MKNNNPWFEGRNPGGRSARKDIYGEKIPGWFIGRKEGFLHPKVLSNEINQPTNPERARRQQDQNPLPILRKTSRGMCRECCRPSDDSEGGRKDGLNKGGKKGIIS